MVLYHGLQHLQIWVSMGFLEPTPLDTFAVVAQQQPGRVCTQMGFPRPSKALFIKTDGGLHCASPSCTLCMLSALSKSSLRVQDSL